MESREELGKLTEEQMDDIVLDMKSQEAATINNAGEEAQINFILATGGYEAQAQPGDPEVRPKAGTEWVNVYVRGGVAEVDRSSGVRVELLDFDNDGCECDPAGVNGKPHSHEIFEAS
jgi:hypothetical protein